MTLESLLQYSDEAKAKGLVPIVRGPGGSTFIVDEYTSPEQERCVELIEYIEPDFREEHEEFVASLTPVEFDQLISI